MAVLLFALIGTLLGSLLALIPALHIYNVAGLLLLLTLKMENLLAPEQLTWLFLGMVVGYAMLNTIPSVFFSVPDDSTVFVVLPAQKYLFQQRGYEAAVLTGLGGLGGVVVLVALTPIASSWLPLLRRILQPHLAWILLVVILFMLMSEWPKGSDRAKTGGGKFLEAWTGLAAGLLTFALSGILGFVLMYRNIVPAEMAFQNLLPAFMGLFAVPWLLQNMLGQVQLPPQHLANTVDLTPALWLRGVGAGAAGGLFAAFFPVVTGGIGGFLAGHATAQRDDRLFLVSQGASKIVYYVGGFLLFFVPGLHLTRGGMAWMVSTVFSAHTPQAYYQAVGAIAVSGALAFLLLLVLARPVARLVGRVSTRWLSAGTLLLLLVIVLGFTGLGGLAVAAVAAGIGLIPVMWGSRRMNCMGVLLLPITLNMLGLGAAVAGWLGLV